MKELDASESSVDRKMLPLSVHAKNPLKNPAKTP